LKVNRSVALYRNPDGVFADGIRQILGVLHGNPINSPSMMRMVNIPHIAHEQIKEGKDNRGKRGRIQPAK
jgi:hypothetical protein